MKKILMIEDDTDLQEGLSFSLRLDRYETACASTCREGLSFLNTGHFDLILLDCNLPDGNGFDLCSQIRTFSQIPILMLTARETEMDEVKALELGADDYVPKSFSARELLARIRAVLRRMENAELPENSDRPDGMLCVNGLCMNPQTMKVTLNNESLELTNMEFQLLYHLARGAGRIFSREDLLILFTEKEWNKFDRCVDVHVSSLRKKLGDNSRCPTYLKTVRGLGYLFIKQSDA